MNVGMLWFDNDPKTRLEDKIIRATDYYKEKYGSTPTRCYINPVHLKSAEIGVVPVLVLGHDSVLPNHLWIGV